MHSCEADFILIHTPNKNIFDVKPNKLLLDATVFNGKKSNKFIRIVERKDEFIRMSEDSFEEKSEEISCGALHVKERKGANRVA